MSFPIDLLLSYSEIEKWGKDNGYAVYKLCLQPTIPPDRTKKKRIEVWTIDGFGGQDEIITRIIKYDLPIV